MVLNVGIVSAFIVYKNRPGAQTRLQILQKKLKQKPIFKKILYSYPIKNLFLITIIILFMIGMTLFIQQYHNQIQQKNTFKNINIQDKIEKHVNIQFLQQNENHFKILNKFQQQDKNSISNFQIQKSQQQVQYIKVKKIVFWILIFFSVPLFILIKITKFQRIIIKSRKALDVPDKVGQVDKQQLSLFGWNKYQTIQCYLNDKFIIQLCGDDRFTNKNNYYAIKRITQLNRMEMEGQNYFQCSSQSYKQLIIIKRGNIYQARQTIIYLSHIMKKQANLKIKNAPSRKTKSNIF